MKNLKNVISVVSLVLAMFIGVNVNAQVPDIDWTDNGNSTVQQYSNSNNPYDYAGKQHNQIVSEFLTKYGNEKLSIEETIKLTNKICDEHDLQGERLTLKQFNYGMSDIKNNFRGTVEKSNLSSNGKKELQTLLDYMVVNGFKGSVNKEEVIGYIKDFENGILKNRELKENDKVTLLQLSSVGRYSVGMWHNSYNTTMSEKRTPGWLRWLIVGAADVAGGVAGGGAFSVATGAAASTTANTLVSEVDKEK